MFKLKHKRSAFFITSLVTFFILGMFLFFKNFAPYSLFENKFKDYFGLSIELINPKSVFSLNLNFTTKADFINIYDLDKKNQYVTIKNPTISFKPLSLIFNKLYIKALNANQVQINHRFCVQ